MSKDTTNSTPTHHVYLVEGKGDDSSFWTRIGAAWQHADGNGLNLTLTLLPLDGRVVIRTAKVATERKGRGQ